MAQAYELPPITISTDDTANSAKQSLSNFALESSIDGARSGGKVSEEAAKNAVSGAAKELSSGALNDVGSGSLNDVGSGTLKDLLSGSPKDLLPGAATANEAKRALDGNGRGDKSSAEGANTLGQAAESAKHLTKIADSRGDSIRDDMARIKRPITDKDRQAAKDMLAKDIDPALSDADKKLMKDLQGSLIDGDLGKLKETLKELSADPKKLANFLESVNKQMNKHETLGGLELATDGKGNVLVYENNGKTAVSVDPKTGETSVRPVTRQDDGSVVLLDGEVLNRTPESVLTRAADAVTRSMTWKLDRKPFHPVPRGFDQLKMPDILKGKNSQEQLEK